jgi:GMP synthase (glutamine-hydrolysing)
VAAGGPVPRVLLVSLRDPDDPMAAHEARCFAARAGLPGKALHVHPVPTGPPDLSGTWDALLFGGSGAYSVLDPVPWIGWGRDAVLEAIDRRIPTWASCFGFQAAAHALGGQVTHDPSRAEIGAVQVHRTPEGARDPLFADLPDTFWVQQGHQDHVDRLPPGTRPLVRGSDAVPHQALRVDGAPFWAAQFHPELTPAATVDRLRHYGTRYVAPEAMAATEAAIRRGSDTPALASLLARVVRWGR